MAKKKRTSSFRGKVNSDAKRQKANASSFGYLKLPKGVSVYQPTPGSREKFDVLPYEVTTAKHPDLNAEVGIAEKGELWYKRPFKIHVSVGVDEEKVVCLTSFGEKCPICEYRKKRAKEGADKDELQVFNAKQRNLYVVIPIGVKKLEQEPHIFDMSQYLFQNLLNDELEEDEDFEVFPDVEEGLTLQVRWSEKKVGKHTFADASRIDFRERDEAYDESILEDIPNLDEVLAQLSYDALSAKFFELDEGEVADEDEDEKPKLKSKTTSKAKKKAKPEPDEDEDEDGSDTDLEWSDIADMDVTELVDVIEAKELDVDPDDFEDVDELQKAIAEELDIEITKKKSVKKTVSKKPPVKKETPKKKPAKKSKKDAEECPEGGEFGVDTDDLADDVCDDCPLWDACIDAKEAK